MIFGRELKTKTSDIKSGITTDSNSAALSMRLVYIVVVDQFPYFLKHLALAIGASTSYTMSRHTGLNLKQKSAAPYLFPTLIFHARNTIC